MAVEQKRIERAIFDTTSEALSALSGKVGSRVYVKETGSWLFNDGDAIVEEKEYNGEIESINNAIDLIDSQILDLNGQTAAISDDVAALEAAVANIPEGPQGPQGPPGASLSPLFGKMTLPPGTLPEFIENYSVRNPLMLLEYKTLQYGDLDTARIYLNSAKAISGDPPYWYRGFEDTADYVRVYLTEADANTDTGHIAEGNVDAGTPGYYPLESVSTTDEVFAWFKVNDTFSWGFYSSSFGPYLQSNSFQFDKTTAAVGDSYELDVQMFLNSDGWSDSIFKVFPFLSRTGGGSPLDLVSNADGIEFTRGFLNAFLAGGYWYGPFPLPFSIEIAQVTDSDITFRTWITFPFRPGIASPTSRPVFYEATIALDDLDDISYFGVDVNFDGGSGLTSLSPYSAKTLRYPVSAIS